MQQHQRFLEVRACPGVAHPGAVWCPRWSWQPQVPQWHWAQGQECGTGAIGIVLQQHQSLVGKGAVEVSVCQLLYSLVLRQPWGAPGAEVAHGGAAAGTLLLLLPKGRQGWHGQQNPSHSPSVSQSLLWTVAAPQLGSPLVWKSSLSLAHPWLIHHLTAQQKQGWPFGSVLENGTFPNCTAAPQRGSCRALCAKLEKVPLSYG